MTRYASLTRKQAWIVVACTLACLISCLLPATRGAPLLPENKIDDTDAKMYRRVVQRVQAGENYYSALGDELRKGHYTAGSVFNWRSPFHLVAFAVITEPAGRWVLAAAALAASVMASLATQRTGGPGIAQFIVTGLAVSECFLFNFDFDLVSEVWSGVLILISITAYVFGWWRVGVVSGILALLWRELALPYVVAGAAIAAWRKRKLEFVWWVAGLGVWTGYYLVHLHLAASHITSADTVGQGWIRFGGTRFLLATTRISLLAASPAWVSAILLPLMLLGLAGWKGDIGIRAGLVVAVYMTVFSIFGVPAVDFYWGAITNPLLAFGLVWSVPALRDLFRSLRRRQPKLAPAP